MSHFLFSADTSTGKKKNSTSLPSSPISIHIDVMSNTSEHANPDEFMDNNVKVMVDRFEITKMRHQKPNLSFRHIQRPKSLYSSLSSQNPILFNPSQNLLTSTGNSKTGATSISSTSTFRKMQQHGRTHPLTIMNKMFNPSTAYNTM